MPPKENRNNKVVFLMHYEDGSSMDWVMNTGGKSPAYILARKGYDVWLGNNRGNFYSYESTNSTYKDKEFWAFSQEDIGTIDIPSMIEYIR